MSGFLGGARIGEIPVEDVRGTEDRYRLTKRPGLVLLIGISVGWSHVKVIAPAAQ